MNDKIIYMCGRFTLKTLPDQIEARFGAKFNERDKYKQNLNISPTQTVPVIPDYRPDEIIWMRWGIVPGWWKGSKTGLINIRSESLRTKKVFNKMFAEQRCIIPADGFYEWSDEVGQKIPYLFSRSDAEIFSFAGLWFKNESGLSVAIITCEPNNLVKKVHDRMPCILKQQDEKEWLNQRIAKNNLEDFLKPITAENWKVEKMK